MGAFGRARSNAPQAIGDIEVRLVSPDPTGDEPASAHYRVDVRYDDGTTRVVQGDLVPHITQQQINGLLNFMAALRTKAETEILP